jgi:hypothetical protein
MLDTLLRVVGVDLQAQIAQVKAHLEAFKDQTEDEVRQEVKEAGVMAGLAFAAIAALAGTCVVALMALYMWVDMQKGPFIALAAVGSLTTLSAAILFAVTMARANRKTTVRPAAVVPPRPAMATPRAALNASTLMQPPSANASMFEVITHRMTTRAAGATDEAIDAASELVGNGSRGTLIGTLVVTVLVGLMIGRQRSA